jgi:hypothetical protein
MEPNDRNGPGDEQRSAKKKRAPNARKRAPKAVTTAEENGATPTEREVAPQTEPVPAQTQARVQRGTDESRNPGQRSSGERSADLGSDDGRNFGDRDANSAADVATDLKSWVDTRREDRDAPREVL